MTYFWIDTSLDVRVTYEELLHAVNGKSSYCPILKPENAIAVFIEITFCMINGLELTLIDSDLSEAEIRNLGLDPRQVNTKVSQFSTVKFSDVKDLISAIYICNTDFKLNLYSSGTSGKPTKVRHTFQTISRQLRRGQKYENNIWGFCYNPCHIAGVQVFLQAIVNKNLIINLFDIQKEVASKLIETFNITHLSATPTFYNTLIPFLKGEQTSIKVVTSGGERLRESTKTAISKFFPHASVRNIYALTEVGSLLVSRNDTFIIPENYQHLIKISESNELIVHRSLLAKETESEWYQTGDIVEVVSNGTFRFVSRLAETVNVAGYQVDLNEVEAILREIECVKDVVCGVKRNSVTGNLISANIVIDQSKFTAEEALSTIKDHAKQNLQSWKIPRFYRIIDSVKHNRTGKVDRC